jgi:hypothetical protein
MTIAKATSLCSLARAGDGATAWTDHGYITDAVLLSFHKAGYHQTIIESEILKQCDFTNRAMHDLEVGRQVNSGNGNLGRRMTGSQPPSTNKLEEQVFNFNIICDWAQDLNQILLPSLLNVAIFSSLPVGFFTFASSSYIAHRSY